MKSHQKFKSVLFYQLLKVGMYLRKHNLVLAKQQHLQLVH
jgi:hypothetical protein